MRSRKHGMLWRCPAAHRPACAAPSSTTRLMWRSAPDSNAVRAKLAGTGAHCHMAVSIAQAAIAIVLTGSA